VGLADDFQKILGIIEELEAVTIPPRVKQRIGNAYERSSEKALVLAWYEIAEPTRTNRTLLRHAQRGAEEFIP
jgi:hypothetical protein